MNKDLLKLFSTAIFLFVALEQKCSSIEKYLEVIPKGKIRKICEEFPKDSGTCFVFALIKYRNGIKDCFDRLAAQKEGLKQKNLDFPANDEIHSLPADECHIVRGEN